MPTIADIWGDQHVRQTLLEELVIDNFEHLGCFRVYYQC